MFALIAISTILAVSGSQNGNDKIRKNGMYVRTDAIVPCGRFDITKDICIKNGCSWIPHALDKEAPPCFYKEDTGYDVIGDIHNKRTKYKIRLKRKGVATIFGMNIHQYMNAEVDMYSSNALRIYFYPDERAYEVPEEALSINKPPIQSFTKNNSDMSYQSNSAYRKDYQYNVKFTRTPYFGVQIIRKSTGAVIFNTTLPGLTFSKQFLQISTKLPTKNLYGFGQHRHAKFRHDMNWKLWSIFTRGSSPKGDWNYYGAHPVYMNLENDGKANMVFLKNSNAMDIFLQPNPYPAITYRAIGGVLDFYIFLGSSPGETLQYYTEAIGRPVMPPYWSLGFHLCKWEYENVSEIKAVVQRNKRANIPQDGQWLDIDYMDKWFMFTYSRDTFNGLPEFVDKLHSEGQRLVVITNPGIGTNTTRYKEVKAKRFGYNIFEDGYGLDIFIKSANGQVLQAESWPGSIAYVDFTYMNRTTPWWEHYIKYLYHFENVKFDGLWIDKNEPDNKYDFSLDMCRKNKWDYPPYLPNVLDGGHKGGALYVRTLCMDAQLYWGRHYDVHSLFGHSMSIVTNRALHNAFKTVRPFLISRSSFAGTGKFAVTWLGDNHSDWKQMPKSIIGILEHGLFGFSMVGADICGFDFPADYEMCIRWSQLGAFYPLARNHNRRQMKIEFRVEGIEYLLCNYFFAEVYSEKLKVECLRKGLKFGSSFIILWEVIVKFMDQDPAAWDDRFINIVREALLTRYRILPYMYTLFHDAHVYGKTVARPLMFEFPKDKHTWDIFKQFLLGPAFMISPVLESGKRTVDAYFPKGRWYNFFNGIEIKYTEKLQTLKAPLNVINLHLRGGYILPVQEPANTTVYSRRRPMSLLVNFDETYNSEGHLFWDDGESKDTFENGKYLFLTFNASKGQYLDISVIHNDYPEANSLFFGSIDFYGMASLPREVYINDHYLNPKQIKYKNKIVQFINLNLKITNNHKLRWMLDVKHV